jgi:hypothetical protein
MKNLKYKILAAAFVLGCVITIAQTGKEASPTVGNADLMRQNLNEPNAVNPCMDNIQGYEKDGVMLKSNVHPKEDLANKYNRNWIK